MSRNWIAGILAIACIAILGGAGPSPTTAPDDTHVAADEFTRRLRVALLGARIGRLEAEANLLVAQRAKDDPKRLHELAGPVHSLRLRAAGITFADYHLQALKGEKDVADAEVKQYAIQLRRRQSDLGLGEEGGQGKPAEPVVATDLSPAEGEKIVAGAEAALSAAEKVANWNHSVIPASCWPAEIAELDPVWVKADFSPGGNITIFLRDPGGDEEGLIVRPESSKEVPTSDAMLLVMPVSKGADGLLHPAPGADSRLYTYHRVIPMPQLQHHTAAEWESAFAAARAAPSDGFLVSAMQDGGWVLLVGRVSGGSVHLTTLPLPPKLTPWELLTGRSSIFGVGDGKAYFHLLNDEMDFDVHSMDLATGRTAAVPGGIADFNDFQFTELGPAGMGDLPPMQSTSPLIRGGRQLEWGDHDDPHYPNPMTMPADKVDLLDLSIRTGNATKLAWTCQYTVPTNNIIWNYPPTVWLDADHVLTLSDNRFNGAFAEDHHVMVVDLKTHTAKSVGIIPGDPVSMIAPAGDEGDAILISNDGIGDMNGHSLAKGWAIDVHAALTGSPAGKLAERPARWGLFTLESPTGAYGPHALTVRRLLYNGKEMIVSVSTDGKSVLWQKRWQSWQEKWKGKKDCLLFYYHAGAAEPRQIAKADILDTPVWYAAHPVVTNPASR